MPRRVTRTTAEARAAGMKLPDGLQEYLKNGLPACSVIDDATAEYLKEKDVMGRFVADCFEIVGRAGPGRSQPTTGARSTYRSPKKPKPTRSRFSTAPP
jgi:hypothetical protein